MAAILSSLFKSKPQHKTPDRPPFSTTSLGLKTLHCPPEKAEDSKDISVDIVAVHGIGADPYYSWVTKQVHWLENMEMLPRQLPMARIMSFGYESQWFGDNAIRISLSSVADDLLGDLQGARKRCLTRPLIFIGHCFGGLVIQQALLSARLRECSRQSIFDPTVGVAFLGTPFRGTGEITAQSLLHAAVAAKCDVQPAVLDHLKREDASLNYVVQEFTRLCKDPSVPLKVVCFYEQKETKVGRIVGDSSLREFVVDKTSGCIDGYPNFGFGLDHFQLNKFPEPDNIYYKRVVRELLTLMEEKYQTQHRVALNELGGIEQQLAQFFLGSDGQSNRRHAGYSDSEIHEISCLLRDMKHERWSNSPRIYIVLRTIGELEFIRYFIDRGITDLWFPFSAECLPQEVAHRKFLDTQNIVLSRGLNLENGQHCHLSIGGLSAEMIPKELEWKALLGRGGFGYVTKVSAGSTVYALKRIRRPNGLEETPDVMRYIESEVKVSKKIRGLHFTRLIGSYTSPSDVGLIISPVADNNLASFLTLVLESSKMKTLLWSFFGCLSNALAYLHDTLNIWHRDIKPRNILVKENRVLLTDFGTAYDWSDSLQTTTNKGNVRSLPYCAPEVARDRPKKSSDIWSLGCVYLEMMTVLRGEKIKDIRRFFDSNGSRNRYFWSNQEAISLWITRLQDSGGSEFENKPLEWIKMMLQQDGERRLDTGKLRDLIRGTRSDPHSGTTFCGVCCQSIEPDDTADSEGEHVLSEDDDSRPIALDERPNEAARKAVEQKLAQPFSYSDPEVQDISYPLQHMKHERWSRSQKIYIVLRAIGMEHHIEEFIDNGITDLWFPFSQESLPYGLPPAARIRFLKTQKTPPNGDTDLENGGHCYLTKGDLDEDNLPKQLKRKAYLGPGDFSSVYKVLGSREYVLKLIHRRHTFKETLEVMKRFESELELLKKLRGIKSRHFVKLIGSYTSPNYVGLIISPVADDNLAEFLSKVPESTEKRSLLWTFFGCLSSALTYLHFDLTIRHKDIKPKHILVKRGNVLVTGFGMALDWGDRGQTTTNEELKRTILYCAPEAAMGIPRRSSSDIWSLGCVYLEMMTVLKGEKIEDMRHFFESNGSRDRNFWSNQEAISLWIARLQDSGGSEFENKPLEWIKMMLQQEEHRRPNARELRDLILGSPDPHSSITFCGFCCR